MRYAGTIYIWKRYEVDLVKNYFHGYFLTSLLKNTHGCSIDCFTPSVLAVVPTGSGNSIIINGESPITGIQKVLLTVGRKGLSIGLFGVAMNS